MKWSKLKKLVEQRVTPSLQAKFAINSAAYGACTCGHAWLTIDKELIANFCTRAFWNKRIKFYSDERKLIKKNFPEDLPAEVKQFYAGQEVEYGELSRQDVYEACWDFIHTLSIEEALVSENPLIQTLAVIDSRVGKRRLAKIDIESLHPLAKKLFTLRTEAEIKGIDGS